MKPFTKIAAFFFLIIAVLHLLRLICHWQIIVNGYEAPLWISVAGCIVASVLGIGIWKESK